MDDEKIKGGCGRKRRGAWLRMKAAAMLLVLHEQIGRRKPVAVLVGEVAHPFGDLVRALLVPPVAVFGGAVVVKANVRLLSQQSGLGEPPGRVADVYGIEGGDGRASRP